ncbi:hypothetical protein QBC44DRAFT_344832 [Cladorrhinum sp. PSN332]|nr:hypothetical protein QBC44DRAFT_344832 [Cladorrhinum sp. PSN332]
MGSTTILRRFKVSVAVLDDLLAVNRVHKAYGTPPFYQHHPEQDPISVTYAWVTAHTHRELRLDGDRPIEVPTGFEELRNEILSFGDGIDNSDKIANEGRMGLFVIYTHDIRGLHVPKEIAEWTKCGAVFDIPCRAFYKRQNHFIRIHRSKEGKNPLLDA